MLYDTSVMNRETEYSADWNGQASGYKIDNLPDREYAGYVWAAFDKISDLPLDATPEQVFDAILCPNDSFGDIEAIRDREREAVRRLHEIVPRADLKLYEGEAELIKDTSGKWIPEVVIERSRQRYLEALPLNQFARRAIEHVATPAHLEAWHRFALTPVPAGLAIISSPNARELASKIIECGGGERQIDAYVELWLSIRGDQADIPPYAREASDHLRDRSPLRQMINQKNFALRDRGGEFDDVEGAIRFMVLTQRKLSTHEIPSRPDDVLAAVSLEKIDATSRYYMKGLHAALHDAFEKEIATPGERQRDTVDFVNAATGLLMRTLSFYGDPRGVNDGNAQNLRAHLIEANSAFRKYGVDQISRESVMKLSNVITTLLNKQRETKQSLLSVDEDRDVPEAFARLTVFIQDHVGQNSDPELKEMLDDLCGCISLTVDLGFSRLIVDGARPAATFEGDPESRVQTRRRRYSKSLGIKKPGHGALS